MMLRRMIRRAAVDAGVPQSFQGQGAPQPQAGGQAGLRGFFVNAIRNANPNGMQGYAPQAQNSPAMQAPGPFGDAVRRMISMRTGRGF